MSHAGNGNHFGKVGVSGFHCVVGRSLFGSGRAADNTNGCVLLSHRPRFLKFNFSVLLNLGDAIGCSGAKFVVTFGPAVGKKQNVLVTGAVVVTFMLQQSLRQIRFLLQGGVPTFSVVIIPAKSNHRFKRIRGNTGSSPIDVNVGWGPSSAMSGKERGSSSPFLGSVKRSDMTWRIVQVAKQALEEERYDVGQVAEVQEHPEGTASVGDVPGQKRWEMVGDGRESMASVMRVKEIGRQGNSSL
ncbi:hypothetical protein B0H13DRAFT_1891640 [Mycena leptocephala]|nr:hypothetical protein B0H13DRAFT_1891640 [Mycena leptocephala]